MADLFPYFQPTAGVPFEITGDRGAAPIGVFDSGAGGLTILTALRTELPYENFIYLGDTAHCPYGTRSEGEIIELSVRAVRFLIEQGVKLVVVACNTASLAALNTLRATFEVPFVGVVPALERAARLTRRGRVGIAATDQTVKSPYLRQLMNEFAGEIHISAAGCPELVTLVERGILDGPLPEETIQRALEPLLQAYVDVIVLGCTHFPALRPLIERIAGEDVLVIDSAIAVARRTCSMLAAAALIQPVHPDRKAFGQLQAWCSGDPCTFSNVASRLLGYSTLTQQARLEREPFGVNPC